ncbi:MAG: TetR/AcrR family transcriptional regulator [Parasphingorhabdus sp.]
MGRRKLTKETEQGPSEDVQLRPSSERKVECILKAASSQFLSNGFASTSIESIAAEANVSKVTVYNHFGDKEKLFAGVLKIRIDKMRSRFEVSNLKDKNLREILIGAATEMLDVLSEKQFLMFDRVLGAEVGRDPLLGKYFLEIGPLALLQSLSELIQAAVDRKEITSQSIEYSAEMFPSLVIGRQDILMRYGLDLKLTDSIKRKRAEQAVDAWMQLHEV